MFEIPIQKFPTLVYIDEKDEKIYHRLREEESFFKDLESKDIFLAAMTYGYYHQSKIKIDKKQWYFRTSYFDPEDLVLIYSIVITEESPDIIDKPERINQIIEEYARGGIFLINNKINSIQFGSFEKEFEKIIVDGYTKIKL